MNDDRRALVLCALLAAAIAALSACGGGDGTGPDPDDGWRTTPYPFQRPPGFPSLPEPEGNPLTVEGVELGRMLFYDPILSDDSTLSCAGCHKQRFAFSDGGKAVSVGTSGALGSRNTPPIINAGYMHRGMFWDGRAEDLEEQAMGPVPNPIEMNLSWAEAESRLQAHPDYPGLFHAAFGSSTITRERVVAAIAQFERILISADSPYDLTNRGERDDTPSEARGRALYFSERGDCFHCHGQAALTTDNLYHNIGLDLLSEDPGLAEFTGNGVDHGRFKTPTLRNLVFTAPYMHDGRMQTLEEVIEHYVDGWQHPPTLDPIYGARDTITVLLDEQEQADLLAFLLSMTDSSFVTNPEFANPFEE